MLNGILYLALLALIDLFGVWFQKIGRDCCLGILICHQPNIYYLVINYTLHAQAIGYYQMNTVCLVKSMQLDQLH